MNRIVKGFLYFISIIAILIGIGLLFTGIGIVIGIPIIVIFILLIRKLRRTNSGRRFGTFYGSGGPGPTVSPTTPSNYDPMYAAKVYTSQRNRGIRP